MGKKHPQSDPGKGSTNGFKILSELNVKLNGKVYL